MRLVQMTKEAEKCLTSNNEQETFIRMKNENGFTASNKSHGKL